jgi:hypothetical protein
MEIKLKGREMPRSVGGDAKFKYLTDNDDKQRIWCADHKVLWEGDDWIKQHEKCNTVTYPEDIAVLTVFTPDEVVELVNRALYQLEYQRESHRKRGQAERDKMKALKEALKATGKDAKATRIERELKGE